MVKRRQKITVIIKHPQFLQDGSNLLICFDVSVDIYVNVIFMKYYFFSGTSANFYYVFNFLKMSKCVEQFNIEF